MKIKIPQTYIDLKDMTNQHIINRMLWLKRKEQEEIDAMENAVAFADQEGDMGFSISNNYDWYLSLIKSAFNKEYYKLKREAKSRNLI